MGLRADIEVRPMDDNVDYLGKFIRVVPHLYSYFLVRFLR